MPTNKNAQIRYQALDKCLGNWVRRFYIEDLVEACNEALYIYNGNSTKGNGVKKRQVQEDLKFMESEEGYRMTIEAIQDGHKKYYRYSKRNDSIKEQPINQEEINLIHDALTLLKRFEGVPQFDWLEDVENHLYSTSRLGVSAKSVVSFQNNPYLKGMNNFYKTLFDAIVNKRVLELKYQPFGKDERTIIVSPYHLKQYNNRWFLIAKRYDLDEYLSNYAIDRIISVKEISKTFEPLEDDFDFDDYFGDVVGVSVTNNPVETVVHVNEKVLGYIMTKPLHESQSSKLVQVDDKHWEISLKVKDNYELCSLLRSYGDQIEVIKPEHLRTEMKRLAEELTNMYRKEK